MYTYKAKIEKIVDGDTVDAAVDLGFDVWIKQRFRLQGLDAAEKNTPFGKATMLLLKIELDGVYVTIKSYHPDKYGRYLAEIYKSGSEVSINQQLLDANIVKPYTGDSRSDLWTPQELSVTTITGVYLK